MEMTVMLKQPITFIIFVLLIGAFLSANLPTDCCWGADKESSDPAITLDVKNEPLRSVLGNISKTTRWKINAPDLWMEKPVTQTLNKVTLEEGLRSVLKSAGVENLLLMYDENIKEVTLFDTESPQKQAAGRPPAQVRAPPPLVSTSGGPDPILERAAERAAGAGSSRSTRRGGRRAGREDD
jgi:hypothetical protein